MTHSTPALTDLHGLWRRLYAIDPDGTEDVSDAVWVQGPSLFAMLHQPDGVRRLAADGRVLHDLTTEELLLLCGQSARGGVLRQGSDYFTREDWFGLHPSTGVPDSASLLYTWGNLLEAGAFDNGDKEWELVEQSPGATAAARLFDPEDDCGGLIVRTGSWFCYVRSRVGTLLRAHVSLAEQVLGAADHRSAAQLLDWELSIGRVSGDRWNIVGSTLPHRVGGVLQPELRTDAGRLRVRDTGPFGRCRPRVWQLRESEGVPALLGAEAGARSGVRDPGADDRASRAGNRAVRA
jgi:hypothetical protein